MRISNRSNLWVLTLALWAPGLRAQSSTIIENPTIKVISAVDRPHQKTALHKHDYNRVMIYLTAGDLDVTTEDGHADHQHWKAGDIAWSPTGPMHVSENVGTADLRIIEIELKKPAGPPPARNPRLDPILNDAAHNKLIFENEQVRVFRSSRESGGREKMHEHIGAGRAVVLLTSLAARIEPAKGQASPMNGGPGDVFWSEGKITHRGTNIGSRPSEIVIVEVK
jgi:quercetin dioxygenase-like cupin family protein